MARCKYQKLQYQVSYDEGSTWQDVTPLEVKKGNLIESPSSDCSVIQTLYRWVDLEGTYVCDGNNKYTRRIQEESYDDGVTWYASYPTVYSVGSFVGVDEEYCCDKFVGHYVVDDPDTSTSCPEYYKWNGYICVHVDPIKVVRCNDNPTLTSGETSYYVARGKLVYCEIGDTVESIGDRAFSGQTLLSACTIPSGVTSIGNSAFACCTSLSSITIPDAVTIIGNSAFHDCSGLTSCTIGSGVTSIGDSAFDYCTNLSSITIPDAVTSIGQIAFYGCSGLTSCTIGSGITNIDTQSFNHCDNLTSITINAVNPPTLGWAALYFTNNCPIYVPAASVDTYKSASGWSSYADRIQAIT